MRIKPGTVYLVGAGPGDPELITVKGLNLLRQADVILYDRLVASELLDSANNTAELIDVGKAPGKHRYAQGWINAILINRAKAGKSVVRLKGGDPFVFGRGFEEMIACREAGLTCHVIPGISSAIAGPASAGIPVTRRGLVRSCVIVTGQVAPDQPAPDLDFDALSKMDTVVILMGRSNLLALTEGLMSAGRFADTPAAAIENATTSQQRVVSATLGTLVSAVEKEGLQSPMVTVIGPVAAYATDELILSPWEANDLASQVSQAV